MRFVLLVITTVLLCGSFSVHAKLYRWLDEEGRVHFGDKVPPKYLVKEHDELNEQGVVTRHQDAALTPIERAKAKLRAKEQRKLALEVKRKKQRDRVLLDTYTTERDLYVARDARLDAVGSQIQLAESIIKDSNNKIETMRRQVAAIKESNRKVPEDLYQQLSNEREQVRLQKKVMEGHKKHRDDITAQFIDYIDRFRVLKDEQRKRREKLLREREEYYY